MKKRILSRHLVILIIVTGIFIFTPIIYFVSNFYTQPISTDITDWASFGSYISGIVNTFIALISLIVLSSLTYFISKQTSSENKNVNLLMRRLDAYESLVSFIPVILSSIEDMTWHVRGTLKYMNLPDLDKEFNEHLDKIFEDIQKFKKLHFFLTSFTDRYEHLFKYDFNCLEFSKLMDASDENADFYDKMLENLSNRKREIPKNGEEKIQNLVYQLKKFTDSLKIELDTKQ